MAMLTRTQYMSNEVTHDEFYSQFVTPSLISMIKNRIGRSRILTSTDRHFNDIPLREWDALVQFVRTSVGSKISRANEGGGTSISDCICVLKQAARLIKQKGIE